MLKRFIANLRKKGVSIDEEVIETSSNYVLKPIVKSFDLYLKDLQVGKLSFSKDDSVWYFEYSDSFKRNSENY